MLHNQMRNTQSFEDLIIEEKFEDLTVYLSTFEIMGG